MTNSKKLKNEVNELNESEYVKIDVPLSAYHIAGAAWENAINQLSDEVNRGIVPPDLKIRFKEILKQELQKHFSKLEKQSTTFFLKGIGAGVLLSVIANFFISSLFIATDGIFERWVYGLFTLVGAVSLIIIIWLIWSLISKIKVID